MSEYFTYQKKRKEYGKPPNFSDTEIKTFGYFPTQTQSWQYVSRDPNFIDLDNIPEYSEHVVNTERVSTDEKAMSHKEGGWPGLIDPSDAVETARHRKKIEKDGSYAAAVKELVGVVEKCISQNNQIDLFEEYFYEEESEHFVENISTKTLMLFKDQKPQNSVCNRAISEISWHPEGPTKIAVSYAILRFQQMPDKMPMASYIWDLTNPNVPDFVLNAPSPLTNIAYNQRTTTQVAGGLYNGLVMVWDSTKGNQPVAVTPVEKSHHDPVTHVMWLSSKTGTELVTTSTDGRVFWWDVRKFSEGPTEQLNIIESMPSGDSKVDRFVGGTVIEYNVESGPNKFLIGTEQGSIMIANKRPKKPVEITQRYGLESGKHLGPVYSINRSIPNPRYFMSVGDWSAKIWFEDLKTPIIRTKYHGSYLSDGCFSPTRNGVFFVARKDGWMDVWDYYYRQNELAYSHKVSDSSLTCIKLNVAGGGNHNSGKLVAIGDQEGTVTLMELCDSLYQLQPKEKEIISEMFDRETHKEKMLEQAKKQNENLKKNVQREQVSSKNAEAKKQEKIKEVEDYFFKNVKIDADETDKMEEGISDQYTKQKTSEIMRKPSDKSDKKEDQLKSQEPSKEERNEEGGDENDGDYQGEGDQGNDQQGNQENEEQERAQNESQEKNESQYNNQQQSEAEEKKEENPGEAENDGDV